MIQPMHFRRIGEAVVRLVEDQRIIFPCIPVAQNHIHELVGSVVSGVVRHVFAAAEIPVDSASKLTDLLRIGGVYAILAVFLLLQRKTLNDAITAKPENHDRLMKIHTWTVLVTFGSVNPAAPSTNASAANHRCPKPNGLSFISSEIRSRYFDARSRCRPGCWRAPCRG